MSGTTEFNDVGSISHSPLPPQSPLANKDLKPAARFHPTRPNHNPAKANDTLHPSRPRTRQDSNGAAQESNMFAKKKVIPLGSAGRPPLRSALSAKLASSDSVNPFAELYSAISGRGASSARTVQVYFPHAEQPRHKPLELLVRTDATVEEVIGFSLWSYWEERWLPKLDEGLSGENDSKWKIRLSTTGWVLRMAEDDGEVDDDCPGGLYHVFINDLK